MRGVLPCAAWSSPARLGLTCLRSVRPSASGCPAGAPSRLPRGDGSARPPTDGWLVATDRGRRWRARSVAEVMLIRGPATATFGTECSQSCWAAPPMTSRSPCPRRNDSDDRRHRGRSRNGPGRADAHDGDDGIDLGVAHAVPVPGDAVGARPVVVAADRVEGPAVVARQRPAGARPAPGAAADDRPRSTTTPAAAPDQPVVHRHRPLAPRQPGHELGEDVVGARPASGAGGRSSTSRPAAGGAAPRTTGRARARPRRTGWPATRPRPAGPSHPAGRSPSARRPGVRRVVLSNTCSPYMCSNYRPTIRPRKGLLPSSRGRRCRLRMGRHRRRRGCPPRPLPGPHATPTPAGRSRPSTGSSWSRE